MSDVNGTAKKPAPIDLFKYGINQIPLEIIQAVLDEIHAECVELVSTTPESLRSEFGFGRANGIMLTLARIRTLLNERMDEQARKQEEFEKEF